MARRALWCVGWLAAVCLVSPGRVANAQNGPLAERMRETFARLDANGDMVVEPTEVPEEGLPAFNRLLKRGDADKDGKLSFEEIRTLMQKVQAAGPNGGAMFERLRAMDKNGDGKIQREEFGGPPALFDRLDLNKDGVIEKGERQKKET